MKCLLAKCQESPTNIKEKTDFDDSFMDLRTDSFPDKLTT